MKDRNIVVVNVPFTFSEKELCPLNQVSIDTLKLINFLKSRNNKVDFVNMRSIERYKWKKKIGGLNSGKEIQMHICSKKQNYLFEKLSGLKNIEKIIIDLNFSFSPYLYDFDVIRSIIQICQRCHPRAEINFFGNFFEYFKENLINEFNVSLSEISTVDIEESTPDFSYLKDEDYGLFQLNKGCINNCSFCIAGKSEFFSFDNNKTVEYIKRQYGMGIKEFWNWDQNVLANKKNFEDFIDKLIDLDIDITLNFALGFQPDLLSENLIKKLNKLKIGVLTVPFETGSVDSYKKIKKPYTIINSIKSLFLVNKYAGKNIGRIQSSFVIGYSHDDFSSIFRIYLSILRMKSNPIPFPLFVFPGTEEFKKNREELKEKRLDEFHGQLWPLVTDSKVDDYKNLLRFLSISELDRAKKSLNLLNKEMSEAFLDELKINEYFVQMCLDSQKDDIIELEKIEKKAEIYEKRNEKILHICASPKTTDESTSKQLGTFFCNEYVSLRPNCDVENLDLSAEPIDFVSEEYVYFIEHKLDFNELTEKTKKQIELTDKYIRLLRLADRVVISTPMYTLSIPSILKAFFEMISSRLFYDLNDKINTKPVYCILTRDGEYENFNAKKNIQEFSILTALGFIGIGENIDFICAEGLYSKDKKDKTIKETKNKIRDYVSGL